MARGWGEGKTPLRNFRCDDQMWFTAKAIAQAEGRTLTEVLVTFLEGYIAEHHETR